MLIRVICEKCKQELQVSTVKNTNSETIVMLESCNGHECFTEPAPKNNKIDRVMTDMLIIDIGSEPPMRKDL